jgi:hypothetical protein
MKFFLPPNNRDQPDEVLLDDLRRVSETCCGAALTRERYSEHGRFAPATIANRFGGWGKALTTAGVSSARHFDVSAEEALADLKRVAALLNARTVSVVQYREHGRFSESPYTRHFGGWVQALRAAGLALNERFHERSSDEELLENLEVVWTTLGRPPKRDDMQLPLSRYSAEAYKRRFGGWRNALEAFVTAAERPAETPEHKTIETQVRSEVSVTLEQPSRVRGVGWRLRWLVMKRDRFCCRACGRSPATHPGTVLHVDHVLPWSKGGLTVESNLQTLCEQCNGGKGAV